MQYSLLVGCFALFVHNYLDFAESDSIAYNEMT